MNIRRILPASAALILAVLLTGCGVQETLEETPLALSYNDVVEPVGSVNGYDMLGSRQEKETESETTTEAVTEITTTEEETTTVQETTAISEVDLVLSLPVKYGDYSEDVAKFQQRLADLGYIEDDSVDGHFGPATSSALKEFQTANGIEATGEIDYVTYKALRSLRAVSKSVEGEQETSAESETPVGHVHSYSAWTVSPTCTENGYTWYYCSCGNGYTDDYTPAYGHSYASSSVPATCTADGYTVYTCRNCGNSYTEITSSALGHSYTDRIEDSRIVYTCTRCGSTYSEEY